MSVTVLAHAWKQTLDCHAKIVYLALADHADDRGICWPGLWGLAEKCNMDRRTVQRKIRELEALGLLRTEPGSGQHGTSLYHLNLSIVIEGKSKPLDGGGSLPPQQRTQGAALAQQRQPRHRGGGALPPESSEENRQKKEKRREDLSLPSQREGAEQQLASIDWIVSEWKKIPDVFNQKRLHGESSTAKGITRMLKAHPQRAWWLELFAVVAASPFLCGANMPAPGRPRWRASLGWLLGLKNGPENLAKTLEGAYLRHPDDRPYVRGKFCPSGSLEWAAREDAKDAASAAHGEIGQTSGGRVIAQLEPVLATGEAEKNELLTAVHGLSEARSPNLPLDCSLIAAAEAVLVFLNDQTGQHFKAWEVSGAMSTDLDPIVTRLKSGATAELCRRMIAFKVQDWIRIPRLAACLVPKTLFRPDNFKKYCAQLAAADAAQADAEQPALLAVGNPGALVSVSGKGA